MQTVETLNEGLKRAYRITISRNDIEARVGGELRKLAPQIRMPGFRPGKVPANLVRKMHGPALEQEALNSAVQDGVQKLISEQKLRPAMQPSVELEEGGPGQDAVIKVELETLPEIPEPNLDGLKLERLTAEPTEAEIDSEVVRIAGSQKSFEAAPASYAAQLGDLVVMDYEGKVDGEPFEGGKGDAMSVELGSGRLIPGFEDQLIGAKANDQKTVEVTFPSEYPTAYLKNRAAVFDVTIGEVRRPKDMKVDDGFAQSMGLESLDQLRELLKGQVEQELNGLTRTHMKRRLLDQLAAAHDFDVPPSMVEAEFAQIWQQLEQEAEREDDPEAARKEMESERDDYRAIAERRVRLGLLLSEIGQRNGIDVNQNEMNQIVTQAAQQYRPEDREAFLNYVSNTPMAAAQLRAPLFEDKVVDFLFEKAEIKDREVTREALQAEIESTDTGPAGGHVHGPDCDHDHDHGHGKKAKGAAKAKKSKAAEAAPAVAEARPAKKASAKKTEVAAQAVAEKPVRKAAPEKAGAQKADGKKAEAKKAGAQKSGAQKADAKKKAVAKKG